MASKLAKICAMLVGAAAIVQASSPSGESCGSEGVDDLAMISIRRKGGKGKCGKCVHAGHKAPCINPCAGKKPYSPNINCTMPNGIINPKVQPQSGTNVTFGYQGDFVTDSVPITGPFSSVIGLCPVNVHWHLGAEHFSSGEYDKDGTGPTTSDTDLSLLARASPRAGYRCSFYDASNPNFTTEYDWKHCKDMQVGETYEIHWPHSKGGDCGTIWQYQTPFYDGVFCHSDAIVSTYFDIGVQAQVYTIVNDDAYSYDHLFEGMRVEGDVGTDISYYTGSTTGTSRSNSICSTYAPITWQVDRKCHLISASSFDKLCAVMMAQKDDMSEDIHPHGSRELVSGLITANNHIG